MQPRTADLHVNTQGCTKWIYKGQWTEHRYISPGLTLRERFISAEDRIQHLFHLGLPNSQRLVTQLVTPGCTSLRLPEITIPNTANPSFPGRILSLMKLNIIQNTALVDPQTSFRIHPGLQTFFTLTVACAPTNCRAQSSFNYADTLTD